MQCIIILLFLSDLVLPCLIEITIECIACVLPVRWIATCCSSLRWSSLDAQNQFTPVQQAVLRLSELVAYVRTAMANEVNAKLRAVRWVDVTSFLCAREHAATLLEFEAAAVAYIERQSIEVVAMVASAHSAAVSIVEFVLAFCERFQIDPSAVRESSTQ